MKFRACFALWCFFLGIFNPDDIIYCNLVGWSFCTGGEIITEIIETIKPDWTVFTCQLFFHSLKAIISIRLFLYIEDWTMFLITIDSLIRFFDYISSVYAVDEECVVCLQTTRCPPNSWSVLSCDHQFHTTCIDLWLEYHDTCPICRSCATK